MGPVVRLGMVGEPDPHRSEDRPLHRELDPVVVRVTGRRGGSRSSGGRNCGWLFAEGVDVLALGKMDGLDESLGETGEGVGGARLDVAADDGGQEAAEGGAEIAGGEVFAGEEIG